MRTGSVTFAVWSRLSLRSCGGPFRISTNFARAYAMLTPHGWIKKVPKLGRLFLCQSAARLRFP